MDKLYAIKKACEIIDLEDFDLEVVPYTPDGTEQDNDFEAGQKVFRLIDNNGANWGNIEHECFDNLASIIDRLEIYHSDYLEPFEGGGGYPDLLAFINDDEATKVLFECSPYDYEKYLTADKMASETVKGNYIDRFSDDDMKDLTEVLQTFDEGPVVADKNNWQIARGGYDLEFTLSYKGEPIIDCISHELKPYKEDKVFELLPVYDALRHCYPDVKFNPEDYHIIKTSAASISNYKKDGVLLDVLISKDKDKAFLGNTNFYDNMGNFYDVPSASLTEVANDREKANNFFHMMNGEGLVVSFIVVDKENLLGGMRTIKDFLDIEKTLLDSGIEKVKQFSLNGTPLTHETLNAYMEKEHPEVKVYVEKFQKYLGEDADIHTMPNAEQHIAEIDTKVAKEMKKERYSDKRITYAISYASPYLDIVKNVKSDVYVADVMKGKFKAKSKESVK